MISQSRECLPRTGAKEETAQEGSPEKRRSTRRNSSSSNPGSPEPQPAIAQGEPKQPGNIQDCLEYRLDKAGSSRNDDAESPHHPQGEFVLTKKDVKAILSGAPHFLLERGKYGRWYPQVIFPWDEHHPSIQRMLDRKPLSHASFTLCTLHAHLPVPDDWAVKGGVPIPLRDWSRTGASKRATFDVGVFEVPNMLANNGREPGTVGLRHFLELAIGDEVRYTGPDEPRQAPNLQNVSKLPATEAFELMDSYNKPYSQCQSGAIFDRKRIIRDGPTAWKRIGVRDISLRNLVKRMNELRQLRLDVLRDGSTITVLDIETPRELHNILHTQFLLPHPPLASLMVGQPQSLKSQIKTLTTVLATPGAWIDFSLPEWRFRAGQLLWEAPPHVDGDCAESCTGTTREPWINSGMERKWLLVQLLLSAELLFRLDAFVRVGMLHDPHGGVITAQELQRFDKLREGKVNWDLIVVRRFLDNLQISCGLTQSERPAAGNPSQPSTDKPPAKPRHLSLLETIGRRVSSTPEPELRSAWQCHIGSLHARQQLEGLYVFAENIGWPHLVSLRSSFEQKLWNGKDLFSPREGCCGPQSISQEPVAGLPEKEDMYSRSLSRRCVRLRSSSPQDDDPHADEPLGWISRSLLSGFVIPGDSICHLLIGTLLENDPDAIEQLGPTANLYGGFAYEGRSWWSKACIVGRVLSALEGAKTCMGWVGSDVLPCDASTRQPVEQGWFEVRVNKVPCNPGKPRIKQAGKLAVESTPLGMGDITAEAFALPVDPPASISPSTVGFEKLSLSVTSAQKRGITICDGAELCFSLQAASRAPTTVSLPLKYNARFVSAHECRPPLGFTSQSQCKSNPEKSPEQSATKTWTKYQRIPGHPLHQSFPYRHVSLESLPEHLASAVESTSSKSRETLVIDARGSKPKETFARAWCASVGYHALIGRVGRTCVACCVREARAIDVPVVIRVGD